MAHLLILFRSRGAYAAAHARSAVSSQRSQVKVYQTDSLLKGGIRCRMSLLGPSSRYRSQTRSRKPQLRHPLRPLAQRQIHLRKGDAWTVIQLLHCSHHRDYLHHQQRQPQRRGHRKETPIGFQMATRKMSLRLPRGRRQGKARHRGWSPARADEMLRTRGRRAWRP